MTYPRSGQSVNSETPKEKCHVKYCEFDKAVKHCIEEGIGCSIARSDVSLVFRNLGILLKHWKFLLMKARSPLDGKWYYFVDRCLLFGASISCAHFQAVSNAIAFLVKTITSKKITNYLDDFLFAALLRLLCNDQVRACIWICEEINMPVNKEKTFWGTTRLTFLGLLLDTGKQLVCLPVKKVEHAKLLIEQVIDKKITLHNLQKLCGFLNFLFRAIMLGRAFTRRLYANTLGPKLKPHHHIKMTGEMRSDLRTWLAFLNKPQIYSRSFMDFGYYDATDVDFFTDSSRNFDLGFGCICENSWMWHKWDEFTGSVKPSIEYLELYALAMGFLLWGQRFRNKRIHVFCDNMSVVHMVNNMSSSCRNCMVLIRMLTLESMTHNIHLFGKHVRSEDNGPVDALSRHDFYCFFCLTEGKALDRYPSRIPTELWPIEKIWMKN